MTVFYYTMKRLLRDKRTLFMILVMSPAFIGLIFGLGDFAPGQISVGLVDMDGTPLTEALADSMEETARVVSLEDAEIRRALATGQVDYVLEVAPGFSKDIISGQHPQLRAYSI